MLANQEVTFMYYTCTIIMCMCVYVCVCVCVIPAYVLIDILFISAEGITGGESTLSKVYGTT